MRKVSGLGFLVSSSSFRLSSEIFSSETTNPGQNQKPETRNQKPETKICTNDSLKTALICCATSC